MKSPWLYLTKADRLVIAVLVLLSLFGLLWSMNAPRGQRVVVTNGEQILYLGELNQETSVTLQGPLGETRLVIDQAGARITAAPCPMKLCMSMGPAHRHGDLLACVPNRILVHVEGEASEMSNHDFLSR